MLSAGKIIQFLHMDGGQKLKWTSVVRPQELTCVGRGRGHFTGRSNLTIHHTVRVCCRVLASIFGYSQLHRIRFVPMVGDHTTKYGNIRSMDSGEAKFMSTCARNGLIG